MSLTAIVEALVQAGATPEMLLAAVRAFEEGRFKEEEAAHEKEESARNLRSQRNKRYYESLKTDSDDLSRLKTPLDGEPSPNGFDGFPDPSLPSLTPIQKPPLEGVKKVSQRGTRLHVDWDLPKDWGEWAEEQGMPRDSVIRECDKFKDFWISKSGANATKADWQATWRNWVRRHLEEYAK